MTINNGKFAFLNGGSLSVKKLLISTVILVIFYAVGFWGLVFSGHPEYFQNLTPLNLLLTNFLLFLNHKSFGKAFFIFAALTFLTGFFAEVLGVHTGFPFGNYVYGEALGFKIFQVPLLIGLNWLMLVYSAGCVVFRLSRNVFIRSFFGAMLMVSLDFLIEPVAINFDFWSWQGNVIPWLNYAGWFGLALLLQVYFQLSGVTKNNPMAGIVLGLQYVFFLALNLFI